MAGDATLGATDAVGKKPLTGDHILIRGLIVSIADGSVVIHVQQNVKPGKTPNSQFELDLAGNLMENALTGEFWEVYALRRAYKLAL